MHLDTQKTLIRQSSLIEHLDLSRSGLDKLRKKDPAFPKPLKDGPHRQATNYYVVAEVEAWIRAQIEKRDNV
ncbi:TPA: transcriptional regulator [Pseudomonas aeruginosa]|jgi:prophage regulatory protein|uniref:helix-turn-helix transcriptional regulator n=1 Tax=Ectopseudomonas oleovorans TaxID=301 RepID=UPI000CF0FF42|nr:transcriptional regulator [Pseudomonas oleovorans]PPV36768.1 transcriptional regulator [Pseudomonas oleovorans]HEJ5982472.1 transcriptional regulator [Pseudomonas aeruginosa]